MYNLEGYGHKFGHSTVRKHQLVIDFMVISHIGVGKNLSYLSICYMIVMLQPHLDISFLA
jgi:hypothetical protein